jgi:adenylate cyclase
LIPLGNGDLRYLFEDCVLDADRRELRRGTEPVAVAPQVFDLLAYLIRNRERVLSKDDLIAAIWEGRIVSDAALTTRINVARGAIGDSGEEQRLIKTLPRKGFRFIGAVREEQGPSDTDAAAASVETWRPAFALPDKPSIAILPFANLSGEAEQEYLANGIVEDIITELSRFSELFVIARNSSFQYKGRAADVRQVGRDLGVRYVLEGSVRRLGDRIRISAQLIDATNGAHRWAERYDRKLDEVFAVQDEVARSIVITLAAHVGRAETERTRAKPPNSWEAYDYYLQGADILASFLLSYSAEDLYETRRLLGQSLSIDASYARAYALLSRTYVLAWLSPLDGDFLRSAALEEAYRLAGKAIQVDLNLPHAHASLGSALLWLQQPDASMLAFERATALNPNYSDSQYAGALVAAGQPARAISVVEAHMRRDPFYSPVAPVWAGVANYLLEQYAEAVPLLRECVLRAPNYFHAHGWLAATYARLGQLEEARAEISEMLRLHQNCTIADIARISPLKHARDRKHYHDGLRKAGLPE